MANEKILVIEDDRDLCEALCAVLRDGGYGATFMTSGVAALSKLKKGSFNMIIVDLKLPKMDGIEVIKKAKSINPQIVSMIITAYPSMNSTIEAIRVGACDYIVKPFVPEDVKRVVRRGLEEQQLSLAIKELIRELQKAISMYRYSAWADMVQYYTGRLYEALREYTGALRAYRKVIREHPRSQWIGKAQEWIDRIEARP